MAVGDRELAITLRAVIDPLVSGLRTAGERVREFAVQTEESFAQVEESGERISRLWKAMFEAFIGFEMLEGLKKIAEQANEASDALEIAAQTAHNFGKSFDAGAVESYLQALAKSAQGGGYSIQSMRDALQQFTAAGASAAQAERLLNDTIALAAGRHMDLRQAVTLVAEAEAGHVGMLSRYGIDVKDASGKIVDFTTAMERLEKTFSGDAEKRAEGLEGAFGRLGASVRLLTENLGAGLIPLFEGFANAAARLADWFAKLPKVVTDAAAGIAFFGISLGGLALLMPGIVKLGAIMVDGFKLLQATMLFSGRVVSLLGEFLGGVLSNAIKGTIAALDVMRATLLGTAAAEGTAAAPVALIIGGFAILTIAIYELEQHWNQLAKTFEHAMTFMGDAWREFVSHFKTDGLALTLYTQGLMRLFSGDVAGGVGDMWNAFHAAMPKTSTAIYNGIKDGVDSGIAHLKSAWNDVMGWFKASFGAAPGVPGADISNLGGTTKSGDAQKAINDHLAVAKGVIQAALDAAAQGVQEATDRLDLAKANLEAFKATLKDGKLTTEAQALQQQRLLNAEAAAEVDKRKALAAQMEAERRAQQQTLELARALPAADKDRVKHAEALTAEARKHEDQVLKTQAEYIKLGGIIAQIPAEIRKAWEELRKQQRETATEQLRGGLRTDQGAVQSQLEALRVREQSGRTAGTLRPRDEAAIAQARAQLQLQLANLALAAAQAKVALDAFYKADAKTKQSDQNALTTALTNQRKAQDDLLLSTQALQQAQTEAARAVGIAVKKKLLDQIPGVSVGATGNVAFSFATFLAQAAEKSKAFGDVMQFVGEVMQVVAQIIDAFRPVIDLLLKGLALIVNGFVSLWNVIARVLRIFGIHVEYLQKINTDFGQLHQTVAPLIRVVHDIPTLNELASGNIGQLVANNYSASSQWNQPITDGLKDTGLGGGLLGALGSILEAVLALKLVMAAFGGGGGGIVGGLISKGENWITNKVGSWLGLGGGGGMSVTQAETIDQGLGGGTGLVSSGGAPGAEVASDARMSSGGGSGGIGAFLGGTHVGAATLGSALLAAAGGAVLGGLTGQLLYGGGSHTDWGALGGAAGGTLGATMGMFGMAAGPVGAIAGALLGSVIGGAFGHKDNPALQPDEYASADLGSMVMNDQAYNGQQGTFGNLKVGQDSSITQATGGKGILEFLKEKVAGMSQSAIQTMFGSDTSKITDLLSHWSSTQQFTQGKDGNYNIGGENLNWSDIASRSSTAWNDFLKSLQGGTDALTQMGQTLSSQAGNVVHTVSAAGNELASSAQQSSKAVQAISQQQADAMAQTINRFLGPIRLPQGPAPVTITNHFNGDIHGYNDVEQIGRDMAVAGQRAARTGVYKIDRVVQ